MIPRTVATRGLGLAPESSEVVVNELADNDRIIQGVDVVNVARRAIELVDDQIILTLGSGLTNRGHLHLRVGLALGQMHRQGKHFIEWASRSYGREFWGERRYDEISEDKLDLSGRTLLSSREVQLHQPELKVASDTEYYGSVIVSVELPNGELLYVVAAASGVQPYFDEMFAGWTAQATASLLTGEYAKLEPAA